MMDLKSLAIRECETIPTNDKILAKSYEINHGILIRPMDSTFEEHIVTIKWVQRRESEDKECTYR